jgi:anti-sigma B factor antagonist
MGLTWVTRHPKQDVILVELKGRLAFSDELQGLKTQLASSAGERGLILILDLSTVEYADSSGLGTLLYLDGVAQEAGSKLRLAGVTPRLLELFQMTHTDKVFAMDSDVDSSLRHSAF